jgi:hypothetical protein
MNLAPVLADMIGYLAAIDCVDGAVQTQFTPLAANVQAFATEKAPTELLF